MRFVKAASLYFTLGFCFGALVLLVMAELLLGVVLQNHSLEQYIASRDPVSGSIYLVMLLVFALMPTLVAQRIVQTP